MRLFPYRLHSSAIILSWAAFPAFPPSAVAPIHSWWWWSRCHPKTSSLEHFFDFKTRSTTATLQLLDPHTAQRSTTIKVCNAVGRTVAPPGDCDAVWSRKGKRIYPTWTFFFVPFVSLPFPPTSHRTGDGSKSQTGRSLPQHQHKTVKLHRGEARSWIFSTYFSKMCSTKQQARALQATTLGGTRADSGPLEQAKKRKGKTIYRVDRSDDKRRRRMLQRYSTRFGSKTETKTQHKLRRALIWLLLPSSRRVSPVHTPSTTRLRSMVALSRKELTWVAQFSILRQPNNDRVVLMRTNINCKPMNGKTSARA